ERTRRACSSDRSRKVPAMRPRRETPSGTSSASAAPGRGRRSPLTWNPSERASPPPPGRSTSRERTSDRPSWLRPVFLLLLRADGPAELALVFLFLFEIGVAGLPILVVVFVLGIRIEVVVALVFLFPLYVLFVLGIAGEPEFVIRQPHGASAPLTD